MIFEKRGMWKSSHSEQKFRTRELAEQWEIDNNYIEQPILPEFEKPKGDLTPLDKLRGFKVCDTCGESSCICCADCECYPCECEWKLVEETSLTTESSTEDLF